MEKSLVLKDDSINNFYGSGNKYVLYNPGVLDCTRLYDRVLTPDEIFYLYHGRKINVFDKIKRFFRKLVK